MQQARAFPGFWQSIGLLALIASFQMIAAGLFAAFGMRELSAGHLALVNFVTISLGIWLGLLFSKQRFSDVFPLRFDAAPIVFAAVVTMAGGIILLSEADNLMRTILPPPDWLVRIFENLTTGEEGMFGSFLALVVVAPLTEEYLFRGLILNGFLKRYTRLQAILLSSFLFGAFHFNPWQFVGAFALGSLFAWLYVKTRSLFLPLLGHALNNAMPLILTKIDVNVQGFSSELGATVEFQPLWFDLLGLILLVSGLWILQIQFQERQEPADSDSHDLFLDGEEER